MTTPCLNHDDDYELSPSSTLDYDDPLLYGDEYESHSLTGKLANNSAGNTLAGSLKRAVAAPLRIWYRTGRRKRRSARSSRLRNIFRGSWFRKFALLSYGFLALIIIISIIGFTFFPSYTHLPPHYARLRRQATSSQEPGRGNISNQKVFIAASIYDRGGRLTGGDWGKHVLDLIQLLGPQNTYLSIYENDSGPEGQAALEEFEKKVDCEHKLSYEEHVNMDDIPHVKLPDGTERVKRIAYLAEVRNKALIPLQETNVKYDKLLYLNDVVFDPVDVLQLLFSTNMDGYGRTNYRAACAVDFINPFKFYDTFATRDMGGYSMGTPFFPWFAAGGDKNSHQDVVFNKDAVRVRSCWGGMVAFDAAFFQRPEVTGVALETAANHSPSNLTAPYQFRVEQDTYWDASECCLIQADIQSTEPGHSEIYMNPYVRVAYDSRTLSWLGFTRRFERLYTPIHVLVDILVNMPGYNPRRGEHAWQQVDEEVWVPEANSPHGGSFESVTRLADHAGFCGKRQLSVIKKDITAGERNWEHLPMPS